jgi:hypothetical protein
LIDLRGGFFLELTLMDSQIEKVAAFCGLQLTRVPRVKDIEHEVVSE